MTATKSKKSATKKTGKKVKLKETPIEVILNAGNELRKNGVDLSYLLK